MTSLFHWNAAGSHAEKPDAGVTLNDPLVDPSQFRMTVGVVLNSAADGNSAPLIPLMLAPPVLVAGF